MAPVHLVHHAANRGHPYPPSSLSGLRYCLEAGAALIEVDIRATSDGEYALLHDSRLENQTTGWGAVASQTARTLEGVELLVGGRPSGEPVALLSQAVALAGAYSCLCELQLDLKVDALLSSDALRSLLSLVEPLRPRVRITTDADWALRALCALAPHLALGFDPLAYLDVWKGGAQPATTPPFRRGAHGYRDDHPLAVAKWGTPAAYLEARAEALWAQAPPGVVWYIRGGMLERALDDGFDWVAWLHERGALVDTWTLDAERPDDLLLARRLAEAGVDRITTNDAPALAAHLEPASAY